jgi:hypothetical protein
MKKFRDIVSKDKVSGFEASARNSIANRKQLDEKFELKLKKLTEEKLMKKQTAVDWLIEQVKSPEWQDMFIWHKEEVFEKAREMQRKENDE